MFEGKPLSRMTYADLDGFLREDNEEGTRLDYKEEAISDLPKIACAFANTAGGHLVLGVKEKRDKRGNKTKKPDPDDVPGLPAKDWESSLLGKIRDRTRPPVVPEVKALEVPGKPGRVAVVVRVEESLDAPHEVHVSSGPEIPVRRADDTKSAGVDDVERMIYRRDRVRSGSFGPPTPNFFRRLLVPDPTYDLQGAGDPPTVAAVVRPRRLSGLSFDFDADLDAELYRLGQRTEVVRRARGYSASQGMVSLELPGGRDHVEQRLDLLRTGEVFAARALRVAIGEPRLRNETAVPGDRWLDFGELIEPVLNVSRFAAAAYATRRPGVELEVLISFDQCQGHRTALRTPAGDYDGTMRSGVEGPARLLSVATDAGGGADAEGLRDLVREASRAFGIRAPEEAISHYSG